VCGLSPDARREVWGAAAAVLHLGNLSFSPPGSFGSNGGAAVCAIVANGQSSGSGGGETDSLALVARLLQLEGTAGLRQYLTVRSIATVAETLSIPLSHTDAGHCRDALSRALYDAVFG
jgi:myosin heavy subunit